MGSGSTSELPQPNQRTFGINDNRVATNEQARPVPYVIGKQRVGVTFISDVFDSRSEVVTQSLGKDQTQTMGYNYYGSFAVLVGRGPVDALYDVFLNGDTVYSNRTALTCVSLTRVGQVATFTTKTNHGLITGKVVTISGAAQPEYNVTTEVTVTGVRTFTYAVQGAPATPATAAEDRRVLAYVKLDPLLRSEASPDYADFTIPTFGTVRIYWGTETQMPDAYLNGKSGYEHPGYRGLCYMVFEQLWFGFQQTNVQNVEVVVGRYPRPAWWPGDGPAVELQDDCNAVAVLSDWVVDSRCGLALPADAIDTAAMLEVAEQLEVEGVGVSPSISRATDGSQLVVQLMEYFDGLPFINDDGKLSLVLARPPANVDDLPAVGKSVLVEKPKFQPTDWVSVPNLTEVRFEDRTLDYKENAVSYLDPGAFQASGGQTDARTLQRPWVTRFEAAQGLARAAGRMGSVPNLTGSLKLRRTGTWYEDMAPGSLFRFDYPERVLSHLIFRVIDRTVSEPQSSEFSVSFRVDRSYLYFPAPGGARLETYQSTAAATTLAALAVVELPPALTGGSPAIAVLAARQDTTQSGLSVYLEEGYNA